MERYPEDTNISLDDFNACGWREALEEARSDDYSSMWQQLSSRARKATEEGNLEVGKVLWLLADACSMILKPNNLAEPFAPFMVMNGKRSVLPEDFKNEDIEFFSKIISLIDEPKLCARISDIAWLLLRKNPQHALSAIDNYRSIEIGTESWIRDGRECWDRAIQLCLMLGAGEGDRLKDIELKIVEALKESSPEDGYLANWLADLLSKHHLGSKEKKGIAEKLEKLATYFEDSGELHRARDYLDAASEWYKKSEDESQSTVMIVRNAECWVKEAMARQATDNPSNMVAASFYGNAIHKYRTIPRALRDQHNVEKRIVELRGLMNKAGESSLNEMDQITSGPIDISELIENSVKAVKGKEISEALLQFANVYGGARADKIRSFSEEMIRNNPLQSLLAATHISSSDGRVVAKKSAADLGGENQELVIWPEMVEHYAMKLGLVVKGYIWPALEVIRQEHRLKDADFYSLVRRSPVVPPDRTRLIAKALFQGFDGDFVSALHLLIPQIENLVRYHLKQHGEKTTNIDINGIENENGLSTLMDIPKVEDIFGKDLSFELKAIFCDPFGPNLRNELAHGLIGYEESQNMYSIYAWWLAFRLIFNTFWNANCVNQLENEGQVEDNA